MNLLLFGIASPISGWLIDRYGPRKVMLGSLALLIVGVSGTIAMNQFWQFFLVGESSLDLGPGALARCSRPRWVIDGSSPNEGSYWGSSEVPVLQGRSSF